MTEQRKEEKKNETINEFNGFSLFDEVEDTMLRTWNRCVVAYNIQDRHGPEMSEEYMEQFSEDDRVMMYTLFSYIHEKGVEETRKEINRGDLTFHSEEEQAIEEAKYATIN